MIILGERQSHILFGSDFPFAPAPAVGMEVKNLDKLTVFDSATLDGINRHHALALFPQFASASGSAQNRGATARIKDALRKPIVALGDALRNR